MASFTGTDAEFRRYIGPRLRNLVQYITKKHKSSIGACEHCGSTSRLESAHVRGRDRNEIIDILLAPLTTAGIATVNIEEFEVTFKAEHEPFEKSILILCHSCHRQYDSVPAIVRTDGIGPASVARRARRGQSPDILPITLEPSDPDVFKSILLKNRYAEIFVYYENSKVEVKKWNANRFTPTSNVLGNLRSRPEFRAGAWQSKGIIKVHVCINSDN